MNKKTLRKKKRQSRKYRFKGGFAPFPHVDASDPNTVAFIRNYFMTNRTRLENTHQIETPNQLYGQIRGYQMQHVMNDPLYNDLKRKYEEFMMAM